MRPAGDPKLSNNILFSHNFFTNLRLQRRSARALALTLATLTAACATAAPGASSPARLTAPSAATSQNSKFNAFIRDFRSTALAQGITAQTYDSAMAGAQLQSRIQALNEKQPEFSKQIWDYLDGAVSPLRVSNGQQKLGLNATMLANIQSRTGVSKYILVAIWGLETAYGSNIGSFNIFDALTTLAYDGPRQAFARGELLNALKMMQREHYSRSQMISSWAGAFGQTQFMPSTFFKYATDGDGDGKIDLWTSPADALSSAAALLDGAGWQRGQPWGYEVTLPRSFDYAQAELDQTKPVSAWRTMGVKTALGAALPAETGEASVFLPAGARGPAFLLFPNFKVILKYNNSTAYALGIGLLANRINGGPPIVASWPRNEIALSRDQKFQFQRDLAALGFDPGPIDGMIGKQVRSALRDYQKAHDMPADGFATLELLSRMDRDIAAKRN